MGIYYTAITLQLFIITFPLNSIEKSILCLKTDFLLDFQLIECSPPHLKYHSILFHSWLRTKEDSIFFCSLKHHSMKIGKDRNYANIKYNCCFYFFKKSSFPSTKQSVIEIKVQIGWTWVLIIYPPKPFWAEYF